MPLPSLPVLAETLAQLESLATRLRAEGHADAAADLDAAVRPVMEAVRWPEPYQLLLGEAAEPHVLVADDDAPSAEIATDRLERAGLSVTRVADGEAAWAALHGETRFNLMLASTHLPVLDGYMLLDRMRAEPDLANLPVILLGRPGNDHLAVRAFDAGAADFVLRPFAPAELVARVRRLVPHSALRLNLDRATS